MLCKASVGSTFWDTKAGTGPMLRKFTSVGTRGTFGSVLARTACGSTIFWHLIVYSLLYSHFWAWGCWWTAFGSTGCVWDGVPLRLSLYSNFNAHCDRRYRTMTDFLSRTIARKSENSKEGCGCVCVCGGWTGGWGAIDTLCNGTDQYLAKLWC
jgi:hypothetical protein